MSEAAKPEGERRKFRAIKGTRDILPPDSALWNWFEKTARSVMESYNFGEIRLPIFEETELFARSIGVETDVVTKEMYSFEDRGNVHVGYPQTLEELIKANETVSKAWQAAQIPRTPYNEVAIDELQAAFSRIEHEGAPAILRFLFELHNLDLGERITLRPEATASVCRAYIEHGMHTLPGNVKLYYIGPMFRRERPQKGRYRQFYQIGAEVLGASDAPAIDAELIEMLTVLLMRCQIEKWTLLVNSIGCATCRPKYVELLRAELRKPGIFSKLGADSQRRVETNPLRVMDSKLPEEQAIIEKLPKIAEHLCAECREHYEELKKELALRKVPFTESPRLVRGLDYYMRTTFEITEPGAGRAECAVRRRTLRRAGRDARRARRESRASASRWARIALSTRSWKQDKLARRWRVDVFIAWMGAECVSRGGAPSARAARREARGGIAAGRDEISQSIRARG